MTDLRCEARFFAKDPEGRSRCVLESGHEGKHESTPNVSESGTYVVTLTWNDASPYSRYARRIDRT